MICPQSNSPICRRHWPPPPPPVLSSNACNCYGCCREARDTQQSLDVKNINTIFIKSNCTHLTKRQTCHGWRNHKIQFEILEWSKWRGQIEASPPANLSVSHPRSENGKVDGYFILFHCFYSVQGWIWNMNPTWAKYSSAILSAHSRQRARGRAGLLTSAHLISILLITTGSIPVSPPGTLEPCQQNINIILNLVIKHQINTRLISKNIRKLYQRILRT